LYTGTLVQGGKPRRPGGVALYRALGYGEHSGAQFVAPIGGCTPWHFGTWRKARIFGKLCCTGKALGRADCAEDYKRLNARDTGNVEEALAVFAPWFRRSNRQDPGIERAEQRRSAIERSQVIAGACLIGGMERRTRPPIGAIAGQGLAPRRHKRVMVQELFEGCACGGMLLNQSAALGCQGA
jgi:hypothetical protein